MRGKGYVMAIGLAVGLVLAACGNRSGAEAGTTSQEAAQEEMTESSRETGQAGETEEAGGTSQAEKREPETSGAREESTENGKEAESEKAGAAGAEEEAESASEAEKAQGEADTKPEETADLGAQAAAASTGEKPGGYVFESGGIVIGMNDEAAAIVSGLGSWSNYAESPSCAYQGMDKIYTYPGFDLYTYVKDGVDYVNSVYFLDASVSTPEGLRLGSSVEEMLAAYGDGYTEEYGVYTYTKEKTSLTFIITDGVVEAIEYLAVVD